MPKPLPEMIELLIRNLQTPSGRNFAKVMDDFVQRIPNIHSPTKIEFFLAYFLGGLYNFQHTKLKNSLSVTSSFWKFDRATHTLDLIFEIHNPRNNKSSLVFRSITLLNEEGSPYAGKDTTQTPYKDLSFRDTALIEIHYKDYDTHKGGLEVKGDHLLRNIKPRSKRLSPDELRNKLIALGFDAAEAEYNSKAINEEIIGEFSADEKRVKDALKSYLEDNKHLLEITYDKFSIKIGDFIKTEAFAHGFLYGSLTLNFKNRYYLDCYVERIAGAGYSDIIMISRANAQQYNSIPMLIEIKIDPHSAGNAITQIEETGYFQHNLSLRTYSKKAIIAGISFNSGDPNQATSPVVVREVDIPNKNNLVEEILKKIGISLFIFALDWISDFVYGC